MPEALVQFLSRPESYSHHPDAVTHLQTHASHVFMAGPYVFKVKKPVNFGFLDFSTLERRRFFCEREVQLNRRLCPDIYLGVVPIYRAASGKFSFTADAAPVEYAVQMRRLDEAHQIKTLLRQGLVDSSHLSQVSALLERFYEAQEPTPEIESWGRVEKLRISTDENFQQTERFVGRTLSRPAFDAIRTCVDRFFQRQAGLLERRVAEGRIRDCHGDLHLEHIHLAPEGIHIFDCIEFNDRFRYVDVASDLSFLAMDLDFEGRPDLARHFISEAARHLRDPEMTRLIDFYKSYRAYVRGKVESLRSATADASQPDRSAAVERARRYFQLALQYCVSGSPPLVLAVMGRVGSGKSTVAQTLARELGWTVLSSDRIRKAGAQIPLTERTPEPLRPWLYSSEMTEQTYRTLREEAAGILASGRSVILDATFSRKARRDQLREACARAGGRICFVEAFASDAVIRERLSGRESAQNEVSDARLEDFAPLNNQYEAPAELTDKELVRVASDNLANPILTNLLVALSDLKPENAARPDDAL